MSKAFIKNTQRKDEVESIQKVEHPTNRSFCDIRVSKSGEQNHRKKCTTVKVTRLPIERDH